VPSIPSIYPEHLLDVLIGERSVTGGGIYKSELDVGIFGSKKE
jgi:hypothetical protein